MVILALTIGAEPSIAAADRCPRPVDAVLGATFDQMSFMAAMDCTVSSSLVR